MKFFSKSDVLLLSSVITVLWIATYPALISGLPDPHPKSSPDSSDHLTNADLHHLLALLDGSNPSPSNQQGLIDDLDVGASEVFARTPQPITTTTDVPTTVKTTLSTTRRIIRRTRTTTQRTTTTSTPEPIKSTTTTTETPITELTTSATMNPLLKRQDNQIENLRALVPPSQHELVQQLSLLNSLLTSLGDNATMIPVATTSSETDREQAGSEVKEILSSLEKSNYSTAVSNINKTKTASEDPAAALQSLALLNSLFGGSSGSPGNANSNAAALLGLGNLAPSNLATRQTQGSTQSEADTTAALAALLSASLGTQKDKTNVAGDIQNFQNFQNTNGNLDAASSNQISSLLSLLGTLGSLSQPQQPNSLFSLGQNNPVPSQQNNFLANLLGGNQQQQPQANALGNLFGAASQPQSQAVNLGNLLFPSQNAAPSIPGLGLLSTMGSLGSSILSTMSNVLGGSGMGGKPRVRGKGVDTRLGLGYRFGDAADAQIVWDIGPQLFTDPLRNEARPSTIQSKSQHVHEQGHQRINTQARVEKLQQIAAAKRLLQLQMQHEMQNSQLLQRRLSNAYTSTKKPLSLLDMWNFGKYKPSVVNSRAKIPPQLMVPPAFMNGIDPLRVFRTKSFMKRSSDPQDLKPYYKDKPFDDPFAGHSTLTTYEKMLLTHGKQFGMTGAGDKTRQPEPLSDNADAPSEFPRHEDHYDLHSEKEENSPGLSSYHQRNRNKKNRNRRPRPNRPHKGHHDEESNHKIKPESERNENDFDRPSFKNPENPQFTAYNRPTRPRPHNEHQDKESHYNIKSESERHENDFERPSFKNTENPRFSAYNRPIRPPPRPHNEYQDEESDHQIKSESERYGNDFERPSFKNTENHRFSPHSTRNPIKKNKRRPNGRPRPDISNQEGRETENSEVRENFNYEENNYNKKNERPLRRPINGKDVRKRNPGFNWRNIFGIGRKPPTKRGSRPPPHKEANRRVDDSNSQFQHFTDTDGDMLMADSNDRFHARNRDSSFKFGHRNHHDQAQSSFVRKVSKVQSKPRLLHKNGKELIHSLSGNPEADDSFIRRNAVPSNPQLREVEKQKQFSIKAPNSSAILVKGNTRRQDKDTENSLPEKKSVMNFIRNFLSSKPKTKSSHNYTSSSSITSLKNMFSDPSSFNPMLILPIRRNRPQQRPAPKTRLTMVDGQPQIVEITETSPKPKEEEESKSIVHVGEDMSFEDLTQLFGSTKNATKGQRQKKLKSKKTKSKADSRRDEDLEIKLVDKVNNKDEKKAKDDEEEYEDDDGLKGIFIDIDSGEINVLKPVASLSSFEPKKESEEEEVDEYEDEDGDGVADADMIRKQEIFEDIQKELKRNYEKMKKTQERADAKKKRKEDLVAKGMDESVDVVSKYFDMLEDTKDTKKGKNTRSKA